MDIHCISLRRLLVMFERCRHFLTTWSHSQFRSRDLDTFCLPGLTPSFVREIWTLPDHQVSLPVSFLEIWTLPDHLVSLPVSFERCGHILTTWPHSQFCSRDVDTSWSPGLTPSFVREIWTLSERQVSLPLSFERHRHFLSIWSHSLFRSRDIDTSCPPGLTPSFVLGYIVITIIIL
jgi:hypothetical protein